MMNDTKILRNTLREHLATFVDPKKISAFLSQSIIVEVLQDPVGIVVGVPSDFFLAQIKKFLDESLQKAAKEIIDPDCVITYIVDPQLGQINPSLLHKKSTAVVDRSVGIGIDKKPDRYHHITNLFGVIFESKYQFDNFVIGSHNEFATSILKAISKTPGTQYNPFFIHGNAGLGKTHLLQATANQLIENDPKKVVLYLPCTKFIDHLIEAVKKNRLTGYVKQFDNVDVLIIDDIQFLAGKDKTQEVFLGIFNSMVERNKQIILSGDRSPKELTILEPRLRTRFTLGVMCDVQAPDLETRLAILSSKCDQKGILLNAEDSELVATSIVDNIRELEGLTTTLSIRQQLLGRAVGHNEVIDVLKSMGYQLISSHSTQHKSQTNTQPTVVLSIDKILQEIGDIYGIGVQEILSDSRKQGTVRARSCAMFCAKNWFNWTLERIGEYFGGKHHTSVMHAINTFESMIKQDPTQQSLYLRLKSNVGI